MNGQATQAGTGESPDVITSEGVCSGDCDFPLGHTESTCVYVVAEGTRLDAVVGAEPLRSPADAPSPAVTAGSAASSWHDFEGRRLRLAVAMRGGVSLAVWIGGAVAELDLLRSLRVYGHDGGWTRVFMYWTDARPADDAAFEAMLPRVAEYGRLLAGRDYHRVEADVLAGASAGGLNGVLFAAAERAGSSVRDVLDVWIRAGSVTKLIRPPGRGSVRSVLRGDDYFYPEVKDAVLGLYGLGAKPRRRRQELAEDPVTLDLSATVLNAQESPNEEIREGRGGFHFASDGVGNDVPTFDEARSPSGQASIERLALAARSTSSFPGAFEPATIWSFSGTPPQLDPTRPEAERIDMSRAFIAQRRVDSSEADDQYYQVIDGGVFDNIPISRAFRAIRPRPSSVPTRRALFYLDPNPPDTAPVAPRPAGRFNDFASVAAKGYFGRIVSETRRADDQEIDDFVIRRALDDGRMEALAAVLAAQPPEDESSLGARYRSRTGLLTSAYVRYRWSRDLKALKVLFGDVEGWALASGVTLDEVPEGQAAKRWLDAFAAALADLVNDPMACVPAARDLYAAADAAVWMISCVQWLETARREAPAHPDIGSARNERARVRDTCYTVIGELTPLIDARLTTILSAAKSGSDPAAAAYRWAAEAPSPVDQWEVLDRVWQDHLRPVVAHWDSHLPITPPAPGDARGSLAVWWHEAAWRQLLGIAADGRASEIPPLLAPLGEPTTLEAPFQLTIDGNWNWGPVSGDDDDDDPTGLAQALQLGRGRFETGLVRAVIADARGADDDVERAQQILESARSQGVDRVPAAFKLAGTQLANFGGFLSEDWRRSDWWWGRIDASAQIAAALAPQGSPPAMTAGASARLAAQQAAAEHTRPDLSSGVGGLARLDPAYKFATASKLARVVARAIPGTTTNLGTIANHALLALTRPVLVFAPAAIDPRRLIAAVVLALTALTAAVALYPVPLEGASGPWPAAAVAMPLTGLCAALVVLLFSGAQAASERGWYVLRSIPTANGSPLGHVSRADVEVARDRARRRQGWLVVVAFACLIPVPVFIGRGRWGLAVLFAIIALAVAALAARAGKRFDARKASEDPEKYKTWWVVLALVALAAAVGAVGLSATVQGSEPALPALRDAVVPALPYARPAIILALLLLIAVVLCVEWLSAGMMAWVLGAVFVGVGACLAVAELLVQADSPFAWLVGVAAVIVWANIVWLIPSWWDGERVGITDRVRPLIELTPAATPPADQAAMPSASRIV